MAINQLIAAGIQQPRFESPLNMMAQLSQIEAAREANALRQAQMQRLQRQERQENELGALLASGAPLTVQNLGRFGKLGYDALAAQRQADLVARQLEEKDVAKQEKQRMAVAKAMYSTLGDPSRENFDNTFRFLKEQGLTKDIEPIFAEMMMQTPEQRRQSIISFANAVPGMQDYFRALDKERAEIEAKQAESLYKGAQARELGMKMAGTLPEPAGAAPEIIRLQRSLSTLPPNDPNRRAIEARIEALGKGSGVTIETPVPVVDPRTGQVTYATRQEALGKQPPQYFEGLTPRERQNREAKFPTAKAAVSAFENKTDKLTAQIEELIKHPGLNQITGLLGGRIIGITDAGRRAEALYKSIVAQGGFSELQSMRDASTTGGALGNVSNQEGQYLRDAFGVLQRTQSTEDLQRGLNDALRALRSAKQRTREAFEDTYAYRQNATPLTEPSSRGSVGAEPPTSAGRQTALPMPTRKEDAVAGQVYQTARGPARWDGKQFIPVSE